MAEETRLIVRMNEQLLRRACSAAAAWPDHLILAVNVSPVQLRDRALPAMVATALWGRYIDPGGEFDARISAPQHRRA